MEAATFIAARLPVRAIPGLPEIRLHQATPSSGLRDLTGEDAPYWAYRWAGGLALARYLLDHPEAVAGRRTLDLGAGSGLVAIAAMKAGAAHAIAAEIDANGCAAIPLNAAINGVSVEVLNADLIEGAPPPVDLILVGDLFYDPDLAGRVTALLDRAAATGADILVGDPGRVPLPRDRLEEIARYDVAETEGRVMPGIVHRFVTAGFAVPR